jgi:predicted NBD/HSP70 family sugar kinase
MYNKFMYLLLDIGGTHIRLAVSEDEKKLSDVQTLDTPGSFEDGILMIKQTAEKMLNGKQLLAASAGVRALDPTKTKMIHHPYVPLWPEKPLKHSLEVVLKCPVYLENDAALAGLGEAVFGVGQGYNIVAYLTISTGVGGARIVNRKIDVNYMGFEPGQQILSVENDLYPYYNGLGYLESYISGTALEERFKVKPEQLTNPEVWNEVGKYLALGLNNTIVHWSPEIIIIGGGMANLIPLESVDFHLRHSLKIFSKPPEIFKAKLGDQAGLYGALVYLKQKLESNQEY